MRISILAFGAIASVITINSVLATSSTVTSKDYVDAQDALKQNKIPATGTNASTPGDTVVTYTSTAGTIGERGIFNPGTDYDWDNYEVVEGHEGDLVTASSMGFVYDSLSISVPAVDLRCYQWDPVTNDCTLWQIRASKALDGGGNCTLDRKQCVYDDQCCSGHCNNGRCYTDSF